MNMMVECAYCEEVIKDMSTSHTTFEDIPGPSLTYCGPCYKELGDNVCEYCSYPLNESDITRLYGTNVDIHAKCYSSYKYDIKPIPKTQAEKWSEGLVFWAEQGFDISELELKEE